MRPDDSQRTYLEVLRQRLEVQAVLMLSDPDIYLVIVKQPQSDEGIRRILFHDHIVVEHQISTWHLEKAAVHGMDERLAVLLGKSEIIWDKDSYMKQMMQRLSQLPVSLQKRSICREYSRLLRFFCETKECLQKGRALDAYHTLIQSLHSWARLIVCEAGMQPHSALWSQVKQLDPSVFKLYEELSINREALEKRIELLMLAMEFAITSKLKVSVRFLRDVMETQSGPWRLQELMNHPEIKEAEIELPILLEKMVQRSLIQEVACKGLEHGMKELCFILPK